ncbi:Aminomethyltransferase folate-binding domain-containing protein [Crepidotus variabilis]|uniref:Aminomethyltransferase folate-binding domain-containing protein n=1 Tax=Crepidotus variabilis TaxID=179855 RepID=A0A9P6ET13_9AGAR|nr:Aminomethyltransferase folate-binding domain-containing protein [Crepidotus variabilis]
MAFPIWKGLVRTTPTVAPIAHRALLSITGSQSTEFLNGLLATSVNGSPRHRYSAFLHAQGRVMYDTFLYTTAGGYILEYDAKALEHSPEVTPLLSYLKRHVLRSKVKIRPVTEEYDVWSSWGSSQDHEWETPRHWHFEQSGSIEPIWPEDGLWPWGSTECVIHDRRGVGMGRRLLARKGDPPPVAATHDLAGIDEYLLHRLTKGVPEGAKDIIPMQAFPMESNLDVMGAIDFRKGCYVGQELTVRTYHTGAIRKRILPIAIELANPQAQSSPLSFPTNIDIKPSAIDIKPAGPRPRGSGKLLSTHNGLGLALLRLEHVAGWEKGILRLEFENDGVKWKVSPWRPEWWPQQPVEEIST